MCAWRHLDTPDEVLLHTPLEGTTEECGVWQALDEDCVGLSVLFWAIDSICEHELYHSETARAAV